MGSFPFFTNIFNNFFGKSYLKAATLDIANEENLTDDDIEYVDITFARKAREAVRWLSANNPEIASIVATKVAGVIGTGVNIQSRIENRPALNKQIEDFIKLWSKKGNCEVTRRWHLDGAFRAMQLFSVKDGGFIIRHHYNVAWKIPYRFEIVEVGMIDVSKYDEAKNIINGLQKDSYGGITGMYLYKDKKRLESVFVPESEFTYFSPVWISLSQYTAVSKLATILPSIEKLDKYTDAELQAAIERAKSGAYWHTELYDVIVDMIKNEKDNDTNSPSTKKAQEAIKTLKQQGVKANGLTALPREDKVEKPNVQSDSVFSDLATTTRNTTSAATGQAGIITGQDPSRANYSAMKGVMGFSEIGWGIDFDDLQEQVIEPIMERVIITGVSSGYLKITGYFSNPAKYHKLEYMRQSSVDIEPAKTASANEKNIKNGIVSPREIAKKRGRDIDEVNREIIEDKISYELLEKKLRQQAGLDTESVEDATNN